MLSLLIVLSTGKDGVIRKNAKSERKKQKQSVLGVIIDQARPIIGRVASGPLAISVHLGDRVKTYSARLVYFNGIAGRRLFIYLLLAFNIVSPTMSLPFLRIRMSSPISTVSVAL